MNDRMNSAKQVAAAASGRALSLSIISIGLLATGCGPPF